MSFGAFIARLIRDAAHHNTLNMPVAPVIFQRSPGRASGNDRGIVDLEYQVRAAGRLVIQQGRTGADGRINVRVPPGGARLELMHQGSAVAAYAVRRRTDPVEADGTLTGQQRRLRMLGYQIGTTGPDHNGVDGNLTPRTDRATLEFQADQGLETDGIIAQVTRGRLTREAGV